MQKICRQMATTSGASSSPSSGFAFACHCPYRKEQWHIPSWKTGCVGIQQPRCFAELSPSLHSARLCWEDQEQISPHISCTLPSSHGRQLQEKCLFFYVLALPLLAGGRREENKPEAFRNSINKRFLFNMVLKRARDLASRKRREDYSLSIGGCFSQTEQNQACTSPAHSTIET